MPIPYLSNAKLTSLLTKYNQARRDGDSTAATAAANELGPLFELLARKLINFKKFGYIEEDDAVQSAVLLCFQVADRYDPAHGRAFNYFTTCILNNFRGQYRTAQKYEHLREKYRIHLGRAETSRGKRRAVPPKDKPDGV